MRRFLQDKGRNERPQLWTVNRRGNQVFTVWGQLDGAMQETIQGFGAVNAGKANEKSPEVVAQEFMNRSIRKKMREGYYEVDQSNQPIGSVSSDKIDFAKPLPPNLRFFKPQNSLNAYCSKSLEANSAVALRKRDGMMHVVVFGPDGYAKLYGANMLVSHKDEPDVPWLDRYPQLQKEFELLAQKVPPNTILLGELVKVSDDVPDVDDFQYVGSVVKSLKDRALDLQAEKGFLGWCCWDIGFYDGECWLQTHRAEDRFIRMEELFVHPSGNDWIYRFLRMPELFYDWTEKNLLDYAKHYGWEGFVIVDKDAKYGDRAYNFHGKAERPKEICKLKPTLEADFIARWNPDQGVGKYGKGKKSGGVGAAMLYLWDPDQQVEVPICECGGGLTDQQVAEFANPNRYPKVWKVEFSEWSPKGALRFPVFLMERDDKTPAECTVDQRPSKDEEDS